MSPKRRGVSLVLYLDRYSPTGRVRLRRRVRLGWGVTINAFEAEVRDGVTSAVTNLAFITNSDGPVDAREAPRTLNIPLVITILLCDVSHFELAPLPEPGAPSEGPVLCRKDAEWAHRQALLLAAGAGKA